MPSRLSVDLGTDRIAKISDVREYVQTLGRDLNVAAQEIVRKLCEEGGAKATELNAMTPYSGDKPSTIDAPRSKYYHGHISLVGKNAIYDEFGTGEKGAADSHPLKDFYGLNPYNSGPTIHINKNGAHYWFAPHWSPQVMYPNGYTEGMASGKQMYNTLQYIRQIKDKIVEDEVNDVLSRYK